MLHISPGTGGVAKQQRVSAPIGTTVSIANLFDKLPVREQFAVKESVKSIEQIRELLRSYALARPQLKLMFKVLQSPKQHWSYSPNPNSSVKQVAIQLFGADFATNCFEKTYKIDASTKTSDTSNESKEPMLNDHYVFEALLPKPPADPSRIPKQRYFSVDGRPLTAKRGTMKKLLGIYNEHTNGAPTAKHKYSFIRLNINCPPGSYDVNVEPSKDDVLFSDENLILDGFRGLCQEVYPPSSLENRRLQVLAERSGMTDNGSSLKLQKTPPAYPTGEASSQVADDPDCPLEVQCTDSRTISIIPPPEKTLSTTNRPTSARHKYVPNNTEFIADTIHVAIPTTMKNIYAKNAPSAKSQIGFKVNMSTDLNEYDDSSQRRTSPRYGQKPSSQLQEQDLAKCSAPSDINPWLIAKMNPARRNTNRQFINEQVDDKALSPLSFEPPMTPDPPVLQHAGAAPGDLDVPPSQKYLYSRDGIRNLRPRVPGGSYRNSMSRPKEVAPQRGSESYAMPTTLKPRRRYRGNLPWSPPSSVERIPPPSNSHLTNGESTLVSHDTKDSTKQTKLSFGGSRKRQLPEDGSETIDQEAQGETGLQRMLNSARRNLNHQLSQQEEVNYSSLKEPIKTSLPVDDPRAYLLRRQKSAAAGKGSTRPGRIKRLKSSLLPLENTSPEEQTHPLVLIKVLDKEVLHTIATQSALYDVYTEKGTDYGGLDMDLEKGREVERRLQSLLRAQKDTVDSEQNGVEIDLCSSLKGKNTLSKA
ncbi:uncharacterized protein F4822DRAFT_420318 [Hypoxylon trugodes]|uniref:uncharacterized protein n=1 Tax=Hypoxylon trugodes TaxID=326681 RepID=UPI0021967DC6|nr:uncharacterized protein F4822DRAFT_420318 [Hypoxylon trugodes]KAI1383349.1 hypothetical protein F4822DRAFT_420318 [Hypoxylon trugodes]